MSKNHICVLAAALAAAAFATPALAQGQQPPFATTKVDGTDGVLKFLV